MLQMSTGSESTRTVGPPQRRGPMKQMPSLLRACDGSTTGYGKPAQLFVNTATPWTLLRIALAWSTTVCPCAHTPSAALQELDRAKQSMGKGDPLLRSLAHQFNAGVSGLLLQESPRNGARRPPRVARCDASLPLHTSSPAPSQTDAPKCKVRHRPAGMPLHPSASLLSVPVPAPGAPPVSVPGRLHASSCPSAVPQLSTCFRHA